jgi:hypothetical protein
MNDTKPQTTRGLNIFRDATRDAERVALQVRVMNGKVLEPIDISLLHGVIQRHLASLLRVINVELHTGDVFDLDIEPMTPPTRPRIEVEVGMNEDVIDGLEEEGFFDKFEPGEERSRALHAIACMDELIFSAQFIEHDGGRDLWLANGLEDVVMKALLIMAGKPLD